MSSQGVPLTVGTAPRNLGINGYMFINENLKLSKSFPLFKAERAKLKLGATLSNPFKRQGSGLMDTGVGDANFGQVLSGGGNRTMQLEGRIDF
jgi:hypothetical protein